MGCIDIDQCYRNWQFLHQLVTILGPGSDQEMLLHLYRSLIRSKLDYGCVVYGSARRSYLHMLDPITLYGYVLVHSKHHLQLVCVLSLTNLPWNSAVISFLYNTAPSWAQIYVILLTAEFSNKFKRQFLKKPTQIAPLVMRMLPDMERIGLQRKLISTFAFPTTPPWTLTRPVVY